MVAELADTSAKERESRELVFVFGVYVMREWTPQITEELDGRFQQYADTVSNMDIAEQMCAGIGRAENRQTDS